MTRANFFGTCVGWEPQDVHTEGGLCDMIDQAMNISRETFLKHVDRDGLKEMEVNLGYAAHPKKGLTMAADWHVSYHRSKLHGQRVYFFKWSGIEHVFKEAT